MKPDSRIIILLILISFSSLGCDQLFGPSDTAAVRFGDSLYNVLFIGSSGFIENNLPGMVEALANREKKNAKIHRRLVGGSGLDWHGANNISIAKINEQKWDYVVLQGGHVQIAYPEHNIDYDVYQALDTLRSIITSNYKSTKIIYCLPWAWEDGMTWMEGWTDGYVEMQRKAYDNTIKYSNELGFMIAPVGWAWNTVLEEKGYPLHYLHSSDQSHPSLRGSYLMACVIFSTIYKESTNGIRYYAGVPTVDALNFQDVASAIVLDDLELWNIE